MNNNYKNVRYYSFNILNNVFFKDKLLNSEIDSLFNSLELIESDKAFIKKECTGVIEKLDNIDLIINKYSKVKTNKLKNDILTIFRMSIYELLYMDKVPNYATINEAVNIIKNTKYKNLSGYVNATLKNIEKNEIEKIILSEECDKKYCYFKIISNDIDKTISELNSLKIKYKTYDGALSFRHINLYYTDSYKKILTSDSFKNGDIIIQDASSAYFIDKVYDFFLDGFKDRDTKLRVLDTCSAPGGKIISIYKLISKDYYNCYFEARDISVDKINKIKENLNRININDIELKVFDATKYNKEDFERFDLVMCDVPCSGTGVINKKPDIKLRINSHKIKSLQTIQRNILDISKNYVKPQGILSYSTCTETNEENEDNINDFLLKNLNFVKLFEKRIKSHDDNNADGFYMCFLKKNNEY